MRFQKKLILGFTTIALSLSVILGVLLYINSYQYEKRRQEEAMQTSCDLVVSELENKIEQMDAIGDYILSDPNMLEAIKWLGLQDFPTAYTNYRTSSLNTIQDGLNTVYILEHSYRTVFFNDYGDMVSSFQEKDVGHLINTFDFDEIPYLEEAQIANGKTVIVPEHDDFWSHSQTRPVFSVLKEVQGYHMGFIEVDCLAEELEEFTEGDSQWDYLIVTSDGSPIYSGDGSGLSDEEMEAIEGLPDNEILTLNHLVVTRETSADGSFMVITFTDKSHFVTLEPGTIFMLLWAMLASFLLGVLEVVLLSRSLSRPLRNLREAMERTNLENLSTQVSTIMDDQGSDEMQQLTRSYVDMINRVDTAVKNEERSASLQLVAQFDALQAQINPHFLFNVLNNISARGIADDDDQICEICGSLAEMLRYSTSTKERTAFLERELEYLNHYFFLQQARFGDKVQYSIQVPKEMYKLVIPKMTLQQFAENSYKHGFADRTGEIHIEIRGTMDESGWKITVRDNGCGISPEAEERVRSKIEEIHRKLVEKNTVLEMEIGGMGLVNTYARCYLLFKEQMIFEIHRVSGGTEAVIGVRNLPS